MHVVQKKKHCFFSYLFWFAHIVGFNCVARTYNTLENSLSSGLIKVPGTTPNGSFLLLKHCSSDMGEDLRKGHSPSLLSTDAFNLPPYSFTDFINLQFFDGVFLRFKEKRFRF